MIVCMISYYIDRSVPDPHGHLEGLQLEDRLAGIDNNTTHVIINISIHVHTNNTVIIIMMMIITIILITVVIRIIILLVDRLAGQVLRPEELVHHASIYIYIYTHTYIHIHIPIHIHM